MAFAYTVRINENGGTTSAATRTSASFTPSANSKLFVCMAVQIDTSVDTMGLTSSISNTGGLSFTERGAYVSGGWSTGGGYNLYGRVWHADVGGSPSSMTVTVDADSGGGTHCFYSLIIFDVTGYDTGNPFPQAQVTNVEDNSSSNSKSMTATLGSAPTNGNMVIAFFGAGADTGGGFATPTGFTAIVNQSQAYCQGAVFYSTSTTSTTITCSDVGNDVGNSGVIAWELKAASATTKAPAIIRPRTRFIQRRTNY